MFVLLFTSLLFLISIFIAAVSSHKLIAEEATRSATNMLDAVNNEVQRKLQDIESSVRNLSWVIKDNLDDDQALYHLTERMVRENADISGCAIAFRDGFHEGEHFFSPYSYRDADTEAVLTMQLGNDSYDYFFMDWYLIPSLLNKPYWSEPYFDEGGGQQFMTTYSVPVYDAGNRLLAVVTADLNIDWLSETVSQIKPYGNSHMFLIGRNGQFLALENMDALKGNSIYSAALQMGNDELAEIGRCMVHGEKGMKRFMDDGKLSFAVYGPLDNGWSSAITCQYKEVLERTSKMHLILILIAAIGLFILFLLCYFTIRKLTSPLVEFSHAAKNIAQGNFNTRLPNYRYDDEIGKLRSSFEYMQKSLNEYIQELKTTTSEKQRFESELNIARSIQMHMVPHTFPKRDDLDIYAIMQPAKEVGGDLYDFFIKDGKLYFAVGDVSGKGVPASMFMAITRSAFRFIAGLGLPMDEVLSKINDSVSDGNDSGMFVTMFTGCLDLATGHVEYCNGGHNRIVVVTPDGSPSFLDETPNLAIGLFEGFPFRKQQLDLARGSRLVLYTDGVTEAETAEKSQYGDAALLDWAGKAAGITSARDAAEDLMASVRTFTGGNEQNDDITIMIINF